MLRKRQARGLMWTAGAAFGLAAAITWWNAIASETWPKSVITASGLTACALIWFVNAYMAKTQACRSAKTNEGESR